MRRLRVFLRALQLERKALLFVEVMDYLDSAGDPPVLVIERGGPELNQLPFPVFVDECLDMLAGFACRQDAGMLGWIAGLIAPVQGAIACQRLPAFAVRFERLSRRAVY